MVLQLNSTPEVYKEFYGRNTERMPQIMAEGRVPMSTATLIQRRLDTRNAETDYKSSWMDNYFDTGDAVVYHPNGNIKVVLDSQTLREINPKSQLSSGALVLADGAYETLQGTEFTRKELEAHVGNSLSREQVKSNPIWKVLARDDGLLADYTDHIFAEAKQRFGYDSNMGVYLADKQKIPTMKAWCVRWLDDGSYADGGDSLDCESGRLVGIAPEALGAPGKSATSVRTYTMADLQAFDSAMNGLEGVLNPDLLKPFAQLRKKL